MEHGPAETEQDSPVEGENTATPTHDIADTDTKPALVVMSGGDAIEREPSIKVEEVMRERDHGNGTPF